MIKCDFHRNVALLEGKAIISLATIEKSSLNRISLRKPTLFTRLNFVRRTHVRYPLNLPFR